MIISYIDRTKDKAIESAEIVGELIACSRLKSLGNRSLESAFPWNDEDERCVRIAKKAIMDRNQNVIDDRNVKARHILAAAIASACTKDAKIGEIFQRMKNFLIRL